MPHVEPLLPQEKACARCGRTMVLRPAWRENWANLRYCSERCRRTKLTAVDHALSDAILALLGQRAHGATICPSEAARAVDAENWRGLMEPARCAARRLVDAGEVDILQKGRVVDGSTAKGPIRLRRRRVLATVEVQ